MKKYLRNLLVALLLVNLAASQQQTQPQQQQQSATSSAASQTQVAHHSNAIMGEPGVTNSQLQAPPATNGAAAGHPLHPLSAGQDVRYDAPDDCHFMPVSADEIALTCNLRTVNSEFDTTNFSVIPSENTVALHILCNDEIMAKSSLEARSLAHLAKLQELSIQYCKLAKFNRHVLEGLTQLRNLTVRTNNILWPSINFDIESGAFSAVKNLERLDLSSNNIWSLPDAVFCALNSLASLNMSENRLQDVNELGFRDRTATKDGDFAPPTGSTATRVSGATSVSCNLDLEVLDVSYNHFVLLPANGFGTLRRLRVLLVNNNEISMVADKALSGLKNLQVLNLSSNKLVALPSELFAELSDTIQEVYLQNNSISVLSPKLFSNLDQLQALDLSHNQISSTWIDSSTFVGLIRLVLLNLSHNKLTKLEPEIFTDLYTLQILNLRFNQLDNIAPETFAPMNNLHTLLLSHNKLKYLDAYALNGLYVLSLLSLDNNALIGVHPEAFRNCSSLQDLNLNGNQLKTVPLALRHMRLLRTVDLGENMITVLEDNAFKGLGNLYGLRLIGNYLENITMNAFKELPSLQILNLARNHIAIVEPGAFEMTSSIQAVRLDGNELNEINGLFSNMPSLLWLNISDNRLEHFDFAQVPGTLQWLDLHKNRLTELSNRFSLDGQIRLQTLDASFNQIQRISAQSIPNSIELLFLNDNLIQTVDPDTFMHKVNLTRVDLYANQINTLDVKSLRILPVSVYRNLPEFYIGGNPFVCDCNIDWLQKINQMDARQYPRVMDLDTIYCKLLNNRERAYIPLVEAQPKHFLCSYKTHCFAVCHCCEFDACDCEMTCPNNCTCFHDQTWSTNVVECSGSGYTEMPRKVPMDTTELYIDGNNFGQLASHSFLGRKKITVLFANNSNIQLIYNTTFSGLKRLAILHLEDNLISSLESNEFGSLENLRELYLQNNRIATIGNNTFQSLRKLEVLRLDGNRLVHFEVWQLSLNPYLVEIGLADNQWSCECDYLGEFRTYLGHHVGKIIDANRVSCVYNNATTTLREKNGTKCTLIEDATTYSIHASEIESLLPLLLAATGAFVAFFGLIMALFCYRQELKAWIRSSCLPAALCYRSSGFVENLNKENLNDAYFAYSLQDEHFVNQILANTLETEIGYRLCLHYRDLNINAYITDALIEAAESSKQFVLVLSKNFLYNEWSRFEYKSALHELVKRRKRILFILYGDLPQRDIDMDMRHYLRTSTCIEWDDKKFWQKLRLGLPHISSKRPPLPGAGGPPVGGVPGVATTNCLAGRSSVNIYASAHDQYQAPVAGRLNEANNYATINDCGVAGAGLTMGRGYLPIPTNCKFNTLNETGSALHHNKALGAKHLTEVSNISGSKTLEHMRLSHHHDYAVPSYLPTATGVAATAAPKEGGPQAAAAQVSASNAYDSVDYALQQTLQKQAANACECPVSAGTGTNKRPPPSKTSTLGGMHQSFSTNFAPPNGQTARGYSGYNCKKPSCSCTHGPGTSRGSSSDDGVTCRCSSSSSTTATLSRGKAAAGTKVQQQQQQQVDLSHYESNLSLDDINALDGPAMRAPVAADIWA